MSKKVQVQNSLSCNVTQTNSQTTTKFHGDVLFTILSTYVFTFYTKRVKMFVYVFVVTGHKSYLDLISKFSTRRVKPETHRIITMHVSNDTKTLIFLRLAEQLIYIS